MDALQLAAERHAGQTRRDGETPYINHPIDVTCILAGTGRIDDVEILAAALLHDTVEDTETTLDEIRTRFGDRVGRIVDEVSDDKTLPKEERKRLQVVHAADASPEAKLVKLADKTSNIVDLTRSPPPAWSWQRRRDYLDWTERVIAGCRGAHAALETAYDRALAAARETLGSEPPDR